MVRIKVCGIRTEQDGLEAVRAGADFVGLVLAASGRQVSVAQAKQIAAAVRSSGSPARVVGVFVNSPASEVNRIARECGLDYVQLSGDESLAYCREIEKPVIKAVHVGSGLPELEKKAGLIYLLDTHVAGRYGGTGITFDWSLARQISRRTPLILAGGLTPENVGQAIREVGPWGVDVSSGVETDGVKDMNKIRAFIAAARRANGSET